MTNAYADLHLHSYYSDGAASPAEIFRLAAQRGLKCVSLTDHDNLDGLDEAERMARELGLQWLPGVELTTYWDAYDSPTRTNQRGQEVDLLAYSFDPQDRVFRAFVADQFEDVRRRVEEACQILSARGYPVTLKDVLSVNPRYPGPTPLVEALHRRGHAPSYEAAFPIFLETWREVRLADTPIAAVIEVIHQAGGVAVLAHPVAVRVPEGLLGEAGLKELVDMGLDGLEVLHPRLDLEARAHFRGLAQRFGLKISGGSDEHGWHGSFSRLGSELITYEMVQALRGSD